MTSAGHADPPDPRIAALDHLRDVLLRTPRKRSDVEANLAWTEAYIRLELAYGYARVGRPDVARALLAEARAALGSSNDELHEYLLTAYGTRIEHAIAQQPLETTLGDIEAKRARLHRLSLCRIDQLREVSAVLESMERVHAVDDFWEKRNHVPLQLEPDRLPGAAASNDPAVLEAVFIALIAKPDTALFDRAVANIQKVPAARRAVLYAAAIVAATHVGRTSTLPVLVDKLGASLTEASSADTQFALRATLRVGRRHDLRDALAKLAATLRANSDTAQLFIALGRGSDVQTVLDEADRMIDGAVALRPDALRILPATYANLPVERRLEKVRRLEERYAGITDRFGTNSHFCRSVVAFADALVLMIVGDA